ncbi:NADPH:quinone reductase [Agaribacter marinus]|uniref:NADPH:quinone reductase n=1 Tax=Agaribacter marinus TaxID=1431249 RepID=A0AA37WL95_9ALTE|nr:NADPH:quinone reductase [Agaribacter marinus]
MTVQTSTSEQDLAHNQAIMRASTIDRYGSADVLTLKKIERPKCGPDDVVVAVRAASINPYDWHNMTGTPLLMRIGGGWQAPKSNLFGLDVAGVIESVGRNVTKFALGDEVFGCAAGAFAEYVNANIDTLVRKPSNISFEEAAAVPVAALTAVQGLRDHGHLTPGQRVIINGASGGVGTYAVQLAKYFGAEVTGVCSTKNVEMVRALGADHVIDYIMDDFTARGIEYDLILDNIGNRQISHYKRCLTPSGSYIAVGAPKGRILGPVPHMLKALLAFKFGTRHAAVFMAQQTPSDLALFSELLESGAMRSAIDTIYPLDEIAAAFRHLETGHARGKIIIKV